MTPPSHLSVRGTIALGLLTLVLLVTAMAGWGMVSRIDGAVVAGARLDVQHSRQIVQHPEGGQVTALLVREGQSVSAGQVLLQLDQTAQQAALQATTAQWNGLRASRARLLAQRDGLAVPAFPPDLLGTDLVRDQLALFEAQHSLQTRQISQLNQRLDQIAAQIRGVQAQETALSRQIDLALQDLNTQRSLLQRGLAQNARVLLLDRQLAQLQGDLGEAQAARAQALGRATEVRLEIMRLTDEQRSRAADALQNQRGEQSDLAARRLTLRAQLANRTVRAPVDGVVLGLQISGKQAVVTAGQPILALVPQGQSLVVVAQIAPQDIDRVHAGQPARLLLTALPGRTTPELAGRVLSVSPDTLAQTDGSVPHYRAEIGLPPTTSAPLVPGMPVTALIETGARSPLDYLTQPLTDYFRLAFRES